MQTIVRALLPVAIAEPWRLRGSPHGTQFSDAAAIWVHFRFGLPKINLRLSSSLSPPELAWCQVTNISRTRWKNVKGKRTRCIYGRNTVGTWARGIVNSVRAAELSRPAELGELQDSDASGAL